MNSGIDTLCIAESGGLNKKAFGQWCERERFGEVISSIRTDALWMLDEWDSIQRVSLIKANHPTEIRRQYRKLEQLTDALIIGCEKTLKTQHIDFNQQASPKDHNRLWSA